MPIQRYNAQLIELLATDFPKRIDVALDLGLMDSLYHNIPGIRAYWNFAKRTNTGGVLELIKGMALTQSAAIVSQPSYIIHAAEFAGSTCFYRYAETALNITGTETYIDASLRGMTVGAWIKMGSVAAGTRTILAKRDTADNFQIHFLVSGSTLQWNISGTGAAWLTVNHATALTTSDWNFVVGRFLPSTKIDVGLNNVYATNLVGIPASIFAGASPIAIGARRSTAGVNTDYFNGDIANVFYSACYLSNYWLEMIRQWTRPLWR